MRGEKGSVVVCVCKVFRSAKELQPRPSKGRGVWCGGRARGWLRLGGPSIRFHPRGLPEPMSCCCLTSSVRS